MTSKTDAWMPLWIGDYLADTMHLTRDEHGGYLLLIMTYWRTRSALPDDDRHLASIVKASQKEWKTLRPVLLNLFEIHDGAWFHKRIEAELTLSEEKKAKSVSKAQAAAVARWSGNHKHSQNQTSSNAPSIPTSNPQALHKECPSPSPIKQSINQPVAGERFQMFSEWAPSTHVDSLARQANVQITKAKIVEFVSFWLTKANSKLQSEWDKALIQSAMHEKIKASGTSSTPTKFDPVAYVNNDGGQSNERIINA